ELVLRGAGGRRDGRRGGRRDRPRWQHEGELRRPPGRARACRRTADRRRPAAGAIHDRAAGLPRRRGGRAAGPARGGARGARERRAPAPCRRRPAGM
ncbi:MAG: hypothetical protein AVDCRST_MAG47-2364, partial [uncultured Nocardioidaceae bacterium]